MAVPPGMYYEPRSGLMIPDGVVLAGTGRRIGAWFLSILLFIVTLGIGFIVWGLILWGRGQSPAFSVLKMRCWRPTQNQVAGWWWMALRNFVGHLIEGISGIIALASFIVFLATKQRRAIHDFIGGTVVFYDPDNLLDPRRVA
ncbi:MAG TPA: RDD family protein [Acidimicrobiales bacterium]|nr:RDD family protein [Acidimicrobiales bacterium]